jgi:nucleotide-binding universal stress UspA family protein
MEPFRSILVPLDGSELAESALPVAADFAASYGSAMHLVRVVAIPPVGDGMGMGEMAYTPDFLETLVESAKSYMQRTRESLGRTDVTTDVIVGSAAPQLEDYVAGKAIDLVVMTSHGRSGFLRSALGSVTDRLLGGPAPVLVVRPNK